MDLFNELEAPKLWSNFCSMPYTTNTEDPFYISRQWLEKAAESKVKRGSWFETFQKTAVESSYSDDMT